MRLHRWTSRARSACALLLLPVWLPAQQPSPAGLERRARVTWHDGVTTRREIGVATWSADTLRLRTEYDGPTLIPITAVTRLDVSAGRRRNGLRGSLIGFGVGAVLGVISGATASGSCQTNAGTPCATDANDRGASIFGAASFLGVTGIMIGGGIGVFIHTERWADSTVLLRPTR